MNEFRFIEVIRDTPSDSGLVEWYDRQDRIHGTPEDVLDKATTYMQGHDTLGVWIGWYLEPTCRGVVLAPTKPGPDGYTMLIDITTHIGTYPRDEAWEIFLAHVRML